jgi:hypothetical protein
MGDLRGFIHDMLPLLAIAPGDDTKVELGIAFFWIHNGMLPSAYVRWILLFFFIVFVCFFFSLPSLDYFSLPMYYSSLLFIPCYVGPYP